MSALPEITTPEALAEHLGWSPRRVRKLARGLGACRLMGNRMVLMPEDIVIVLKAAKQNLTINDVLSWLAADAAEILREKEVQRWADPTGHVYFVRRERDVKIGFTTDIEQRLASFRSASSGEFTVMLMIAGTMDLERYFHAKFGTLRIAREWFKLDGPIDEFIARRRHSDRGLPR